MALVTSISVYAINRTANKTAVTEGILSSSIRKVMPVRDGSDKWIGTNKPSNHSSIYSQIVVSKDAVSGDTDNYYSGTTVANIITAINA